MTLDVIISIAILLVVVVAVWRGGQANPVGTRQILDSLRAHDSRLKKVETKMEEAASNAAVTLVAERLQSLEQHAASSGEILAVKGEIEGLRVMIRGVEKAADRTEQGVQRIEGYFLEKGVKGQ